MPVKVAGAKPFTPAVESRGISGADGAKVSCGRELLHTDPLYAQLAEVFRALAHPSRAKILHSLLHQELCTCDLASILSLSEPAVSQHLRTLHDLRVIRSRRSGKRVFYSLDDPHISHILSLTLTYLTHRPEDVAERDNGC